MGQGSYPRESYHCTVGGLSSSKIVDPVLRDGNDGNQMGSGPCPIIRTGPYRRSWRVWNECSCLPYFRPLPRTGGYCVLAARYRRTISIMARPFSRSCIPDCILVDRLGYDGQNRLVTIRSATRGEGTFVKVEIGPQWSSSKLNKRAQIANWLRSNTCRLQL